MAITKPCRTGWESRWKKFHQVLTRHTFAHTHDCTRLGAIGTPKQVPTLIYKPLRPFEGSFSRTATLEITIFRHDQRGITFRFTHESQARANIYNRVIQ